MADKARVVLEALAAVRAVEGPLIHVNQVLKEIRAGWKHLGNCLG